MGQLDADLTRHLTQRYLHRPDKAYQLLNKASPMTRANRESEARGYNFVLSSNVSSWMKDSAVIGEASRGKGGRGWTRVEETDLLFSRADIT